jgi:glycosyltransferase involved in cell wall biosynthesis
VTRRISVLQVTHDLGVGGLPRVVETLCRTIDPARFEVTALCLNFAGELAEGLIADGYGVSVLEQSRRKPDYLSFVRVARFLRAHRFDVVHTHNTQPLMDAAVGAMLTPQTALIHTDHARDFPDKVRYMVFEHLLSWRAFRVVGVSDHTTNNLHRYEWIPRRKLTTIVNGIDGRAFEGPSDRSRVRASLGIPDGAVAVVFASRLEAQKDVPTLLRAFSMLVDRMPQLHLAIVGQGTLRPALESQAAALGLTGRTTFAGVRLDVPDVLRASDIFVLPSTWEGLPMVILEALAAGCPIVSTAVGGVPSAVTDEVTGILVPPRDPAALAAGLERLAKDEALRRRLAAEGKRLFAERFSAEAMARRYESLYVAACEARGQH